MLFRYFSNIKLERDKKRIIENLESGGIRNLLVQMSSNELVSSVVKKRREI